MTIYPSSVFIPMPPSSEKYMSFANLQLHSHRPPFFSLPLLIMGSMRKVTFPFLALLIVHQKLVFLSAGVQTMSKWKGKSKTITGAVCPSFHCVNREGLRLSILHWIGLYQDLTNWKTMFRYLSKKSDLGQEGTFVNTSQLWITVHTTGRSEIFVV